ncbi:DUF4124 domain-containing protein [Thermomonas paludicola]|uniref:DUF4124 domain-containing protein n=1 Tax=Thermomonas paludicola TaxID=2884874 RepID=UPI002113EE88|nr:DUF4124 domain-containing protein [Thermomonas paludicola]
MLNRRVIVLLLLCLPWSVRAQETVFYKCTDAKGNVSMQNGTPCAPGMKQEIRRIGDVKVVPVPAAKPPAAAAPAAQPQYGEFVLVGGPSTQRKPAPEAAALPAPPALFQCRTWEGDTYYGETATPEPRCVPLQVLGIDGSAAMGMGQACEMKHDACTEVPDAQLCAAWYRQLDEADFKQRYASADERDQRQRAFEAIDAKIRASHCALAAPAAPPPGTPAPARVP